MEEDLWEKLRNFTNARIGIGRAGTSLKTSFLLDFKMGHALAKDAVHAPLDVPVISSGLKDMNLPFEIVHSSATDRQTYLQRPDLGRLLNQASHEKLKVLDLPATDICLIIADGLSSMAIEKHVLPFFAVLIRKLQGQYTFSPVVIALQSRVALGDEIAYLCHSKISIVFIGERPGLSSPDSLGIYMTYLPQPGLTDESRNCISNIHNFGLSYELAADKLKFLVSESIRRKLSGVHLKEESNLLDQ